MRDSDTFLILLLWADFSGDGVIGEPKGDIGFAASPPLKKGIGVSAGALAPLLRREGDM